jgi:parallel beta-helix repeat protein
MTVAGGLACLVPGDTLLVRGGTYNESISNNVPAGTSWSAKVRIAAYPGEVVWLKPLSGNFVIYFSANQQYIEFDGLNIDGTSVGDASVFFDDRSGGNPNHIRIQNAEISHSMVPDGTNAAITVGGNDHEFNNLSVHGVGGPYGFYIAGNNNVIDHCDIHDVASAGVHIYKSGGNPTGNVVRNTRIHHLTESYFFGTPDWRIWGILVQGTNNQIYNNVIDNINFNYASSNAGINVYGGSGNKIWNNTVYSNTTDGIYISPAASTSDVKNNIAFRNAGDQYQDRSVQAAESHNLFGVDPLFVDPSTGDLRLRSTSRAIDAGTSVPVGTDILGLARPQGTNLDIGAFEFGTGQQVSGPAPPTGIRIVN